MPLRLIARPPGRAAAGPDATTPSRSCREARPARP